MQSNIQDRVNRVFDAICDKYVAVNGRESGGTFPPLPHLHLMLSVGGETAGVHHRGVMRADGTSLRRDALYRIASMTKPITIAAALQMMEQGLLAPDQQVADVLPEFSVPQIWTGQMAAGDDKAFLCRPMIPADGQGMTMMDLMRHTSGLCYSVHQADALDAAYAQQGLDAFHQRRTSGDHMAALSALPLRFAPGQRFHYSASIDVLGAVMERVEGQRIEEILTRRIFAPLGMEDSFFTVPPDKIDRLTDAWMVALPGGQGEDAAPLVLYDRGARSRWRFTPKSASAGGGLVSSMEDYHRFLQMLMRGGEYQGVCILSPQSVALMLRNHLPSGGDLTQEAAGPLSETGRPGIGMGLGGAIVLDEEKAGLPGAKGCYYWGGLLSTGFWMDPGRQVIALMMTQCLMAPTVIEKSGVPAVSGLRDDFRRRICSLWDAGIGE